MLSVLPDIRYSLRMLRKRPVFAATVVLILALGIGVNSLFYCVIDSVLIRPVPWREPEQILSIWETRLKTGENRALVSAVNFLEWRDQDQIFEQVAGWRFLYLNLTGRNEPERVQGLTISPNYFPLLKVKAALGRTFTPEEEQLGHDKVVILSHQLWQRRFDSNPNVIGQQITVEGEPYTIVGVLPSDFQTFRVLNRELDIYIPFTLDRAQLVRKDGREGEGGDSEQVMFVYARLKPSVSIEQAQAAMNTVYSRLEQQYPESNAGLGVKLVRLQEQWSEQLRPTLLMVFVAVAFVLLIACANAANLLLARASQRRREIAIRAALGASRLRVMRQLLTESVLMALLSGTASLLLVLWGIKALNGLISYTTLNRVGEFRLDARVLVFTLLISLLTGLMFGFAPAWQSSKSDLTAGFKEAVGGATGRRLRDLLVISEITLAVVLLIGAGLMIRSILRLQSIDRGLNTNSVLTMQLFLPKAKYPGGKQVSNFYQRVLQRVQVLPGVESASLINYPPLGLISTTVPITIEGKSQPGPEDAPVVQYAVVSAEYFRTMHIPLLSGRPLTEQDTDSNQGVVVISAAMAHRFWPNEDPVGRQIRPHFPEMRAYWVPASHKLPLTIVGVVGDVKRDGIMGTREGTLPQIYLPYIQNPSSIMHLMVRTSSAPLASANTVRGEVYAVDKDQPVFDVKTMDEVVADSFARPRTLSVFLGVFAALALSLAAAGIYAVVSYSVAQRTHEIGIRVALGAQRADILRLIIRQGMTLTVKSMVFGLIAALVLTRVMSSLLYDVSAHDPVTFAVVSVLLVLVSLLATYLPARKALEVEPLTALRSE